MSGIELLLWAASVWSVFLLFVLVDVPTLVAHWMRGRR